MSRGRRPSIQSSGPRRRRLPRRDGVAVKWSSLLDFDQALVLIPKAAPTPAEPDGVELEAWIADRVAGGWEPREKLKTLQRLPLLTLEDQK
jgi:hypothetical protein